ncbi:MAG: ATP-binding protein [Gammaproteobacteria bacterium]
MRLHSIRARTTMMLTLAVAAVWLLAAWLTWKHAEHEAAELFDGHLAQAASMLIAQTAVNIEEPAELAEFNDDLHAPLRHRYAHKVAFQVWYQGRELTVHSENAPNSRLGLVETGFSNHVIDSVQWRVFSDWNATHEFLVQVGERVDARTKMANDLAAGLLRPLLWVLPLLALMIWVATGSALQPLWNVARELAQRSPDRLEPLQGVSVPNEVEPLVNRLNNLLERVQIALNSEKRFTGDAAHELRTPIAALAAQAEVALASHSDSERQQALEGVLQAARRMARLVDQMLTLARADSALPAPWPPINLADVVRDVAGELAPEAIEKGLDLSVEAPESAQISGEAGWLRVLVRNLLDNALKYTPREGTIRVRLDEHGDEIILGVSNSGQGLPEDQLRLLGERFWRGSPTGQGSGLGLSIVRRIAELHGTSPKFSHSDSGLGLCVHVPFKRWVAA